MPDPRFGIIYSRLHETIAPADFAAAAEAMGYDSVWATEGLANQRATLDPVVAIAGFAHGTTRITIGSNILISPLRNPAILAKQVASLDVLSKGRVVLGVGVGGSSLSQPADYRVAGIDPRERGARCSEGIEVMTRLWSGEPVSHAGRFHAFEDIAMLPRPVQSPHPPIWAGGNAEGVLRRAGRLCQGFVPMSTGAADYARLWDRVRTHAEAAGREPAAITRALHIYLCLAATPAEARAIAERTLTERYGFAVRLPAGDDGYAFGSADDCTRALEAYRAAGVEHFVLNPVRPPAEVVGQAERFAAEVMPRFR